MPTLPQLLEEDIQNIDAALRDFLRHTDANAALVIDKGGFLITHAGETKDFDLTTIGALSSGAFLANQTIAGLVHETNFNSTYQQGEKYSLFIINVDEQCLLAVIFGSQIGVVKYFAPGAVQRIANQLKAARDRAPGQGVDLSMMNVADSEGLFRKKNPGEKKG
jgi:predicted regulator of Ras-like GTPase activity (Roadblock/LC7/MglB family)